MYVRAVVVRPIDEEVVDDVLHFDVDAVVFLGWLVYYYGPEDHVYVICEVLAPSFHNTTVWSRLSIYSWLYYCCCNLGESS